jgi:RNA polymerase subunit RPABC4/transcription elongation factor Spt4
MNIYTCGRCGGAVSKSTTVCPHCGAHLAGIRCRTCNFVGSERDFPNDRCPKCGSVVQTGRPAQANTNECKQCGTDMSGKFTCPKCGYTDWTSIMFAWVLGVGLIIAAIVWSSSLWVLIGAGLFGLLFIAVAFSSTRDGLKHR